MEKLLIDRSELIERIRRIAAERFAPRAASYDRDAAFPQEGFADLQREHLLAPAVPERFGGNGLSPESGILTLWMMTKEIARADMSLARCWEGHVNSQLLISAMGTPEQHQRWFPGIIDRGELWVSWSGEPQSPIPGQKSRFGTTVRKTDGGYVVSGTKVFATSAGNAHWAILLVNPDGPGGARHSTGDGRNLLLLACELADPSVSFDSSWWDPIGMRGTVSYLVRFDETFIPDGNLIGVPGQYFNDMWQTRFTPHYAATFLGAAELARDYATEYINRQNKSHDAYVQHHIGWMDLHVQSAHLWLAHVAGLWESGRVIEAQKAGIQARFLIEQWAMESLDHSIRACGARCLIRPSHLERVYRDLSFYVRHDNADHLLATIGRHVLGQSADSSFFKIDNASE